jgi:hypothetical protein
VGTIRAHLVPLDMPKEGAETAFLEASPGTPVPLPALERAVAVLAGPGTERFPLRGSVGRIALVVGSGERGVLALDGLGRAPEGKTYTAWLVPPGSATPVRVATFSGKEPVVLLGRRVSRGASVGVTLEAVPAPDKPSRTLRLVAVRPAD